MDSHKASGYDQAFRFDILKGCQMIGDGLSYRTRADIEAKDTLKKQSHVTT